MGFVESGRGGVQIGLCFVVRGKVNKGFFKVGAVRLVYIIT